jgi:hypothetical protein
MLTFQVSPSRFGADQMIKTFRSAKLANGDELKLGSVVAIRSHAPGDFLIGRVREIFCGDLWGKCEVLLQMLRLGAEVARYGLPLLIHEDLRRIVPLDVRIHLNYLGARTDLDADLPNSGCLLCTSHSS